MPLKTQTNQVVRIPRGQLRPGPWQPRRIFEQQSLAELAASLSARGVLSPLRVIASPDGHGYLIVAGERRWRASELAGITHLPCLVVRSNSKDGTLQELAILDNLHRANLRPGEEARAIAKLEQFGFSQADIAVRLGKSQGWVSQRLSMARLPEAALEQLDDGLITREEALALAKLADHPDLIQACLDADGKQLAARLGGHVPTALGERVQAARRWLELERERQNWSARTRAAGHEVRDDPIGEGDRRYLRLLPGSDAARVHQEARLACEVWAWEHGRPVRYCDKPTKLRRALLDIAELDPATQARQAEYRVVVERESARDATLRAWLATSNHVETEDLAILARERVATLVETDERLLERLGAWLGSTGDRWDQAHLAEDALAAASDRRLIQLWFLLEAAHTMTASVVPDWLSGWLGRLGFVDPALAPRSGNSRSMKVNA